MASTVAILAAQGGATAAQAVFSLSSRPAVLNYPTHVEIVLNETQQQEIAEFIARQLGAEPGQLRIVGLGGVVGRLVARKYWGWIAGSLGAAFGAGWLGGKR